MKTSLKKVFSVLCVGAAFAAAASTTPSSTGDSVLLWMVSSQDVVNDNGTLTNVGGLTSRNLPVSSGNPQHVNAARVRVIGNGVGDNVFLDLYHQNDDDQWELDYTVGDQTYRSQILSFENAPSSSDGSYVGPSWADFGAYASADYSFAIELGFLTEDGRWFTMATGAQTGWEALAKFRSSDIVAEPPFGPWSSSYSVPEPSSGLLLLMGGALLALKRRRNGQICA